MDSLFANCNSLMWVFIAAFMHLCRMVYFCICQLFSVVVIICICVPEFEVYTKGMLGVPLLVCVIQVHAYQVVLSASCHGRLQGYLEYHHREHFLQSNQGLEYKTVH